MKKLLFFFLAVTSASTALSQPPPASGTSKGDVRKVAGWRSIKSVSLSDTFVSLEGRFAIALPKDVQGFAALSPKQTGTTATGHQFTWKFAEAEVIGFFLDFPDSTLTGSTADVAQITANSKKLVTDRLPNAKLLSESEFVSNGISSANFIYDVGAEGFMSVRLFLDGKRLYRFNAIFKERETEEILNTAFKSFKVIAQADVDAELQRKYEAMKPEPLPQSPIVVKLTSDAQDARFKGKVKKVVEESEDRSGTWSVQGRKLSSTVYYDENGALTRRDSYDSQGNPFQITVYGYIDGKRVSNSKMTRYEYDPPPAAAPPGAKGVEPVRKSDPRYEYSFEYKYENGKLAERQMVYNNGRKGMRYVYKNSPNQLEEFVYTEEGKLNQRYLSIQDANGNVSERTDFGVVNFKIYGDRRYRYTYEFDAAGNWTKKITSKEVTENGETKFQQYSIDYRTITYY